MSAAADRPVDVLLAELRANIATHGSAVVAFSAGIDSTLVLKLAHDVLGAAAVGVVGTAPSVPPAELDAARRLANELEARVVFEPTAEMDDPRYVANPSNRCYFCKTELYAVCGRVARREGLAVILNGTNADDLGDYRPGLEAAREASVRSPLLECGLGKQDVRRVARALGLSNWDKPALACLASRLPYGTAVTADRLTAVDVVEQFLRGQGFRDVRARHHGTQVRLEVEADGVVRLQAQLATAELKEVVRRAGFLHAAVEPGGYRRGRLNDELPDPAESLARETPSP